MTEAEWQASRDPRAMLSFLERIARASDRKLRLASVACCRRAWSRLSNWRSRKAVEVAERFADGEQIPTLLEHVRRSAETAVDATELWDRAAATAALSLTEPSVGASTVIETCRYVAMASDSEAEWGCQADLLRDIFGPLSFRPVHIDPVLLTGSVKALAEAAYQERTMPQGTLDPQRLAVLADAIEEGGMSR